MSWKKIGDWLKDKWDSVTTWASNTFGAGTSSIIMRELVTEHIPIIFPLSCSTGTKKAEIISENGNTSKPISVYAEHVTNNEITSSIGINFNIADFTLNINLGVTDIGIYGSIKKGNTSSGFGLKTDFSKLRIGFEGFTTIQSDNTTETTFTNVSINGWALLLFYELVTNGSASHSPVYG